VTSDDRVWYVDYAGGYLGVYDPETGLIDEWLMPGGPSSRPYGMAVDAADRLWFVETGSQPNRFLGFDSVTGQFLPSTAIPSGGGSVRHMHYDAKTNAVWFATDANTIGRALLAEVSVRVENDAVPVGFSIGSPYPNPASKIMRLKVSSDESLPRRLSIIDITGRIVLQSPVNPFRGIRLLEVDISFLSPGLHFVRIGNHSGSVSKSVLIVR